MPGFYRRLDVQWPSQTAELTVFQGLRAKKSPAEEMVSEGCGEALLDVVGREVKSHGL